MWQDARMLAGRPSATAYGAAMYRAAHQLLDHPPVFVDPLALPIVGDEAERSLRDGGDRRAQAAAAPMRAFMAARHRLSEDSLAAAQARGVRQYVVLGAGLDTFAYRGQYDASLRVFEVDHPATQEWKRARLAEANIAVPAALVYAPIDFEHDTLADGLGRAGFAREVPAFFAWLGVVPYLTRDAIWATLRYVAALAQPSEIIFDHAELPQHLDEAQLQAAAALAVRVARVGEPFKTVFMPGELEPALAQLGFSVVDNLTAAALNGRYFAGRSDGLAIPERARFMCARV
jgi:methyltransferase (TIGR00027 family)